MSTSSAQSKPVNRRIDSLQNNGGPLREGPRSRKRIVDQHDAYTFALRVAYLSYILQPRARRIQQVPAATRIQRSSTSVHDLMKDFSLLRDSKSTRFPHGFMAELEKRLKGVIMATERAPEYGDASVKRTFAAFFNAFTETSFKKRMEKDRRVEDLVLIFFSNATKELQKGQQPDDGWKLLVDRHLALFIRLISMVLKDHEWARDRPELSGRLSTLEMKLLAHDQDLTADPSPNGGPGGSRMEVEVPHSYEVKDMPLVLVVARIFGLTNAQIQSDVDKYRPVWTEKAALQDLKTYQTLLNLNSKKTLRSDDFDLEEGYEAWRKSEAPDLSRMILAIVQSHPELAKSTAPSSLPKFNPSPIETEKAENPYSELARRMSEPPDCSSYAIDSPVDMSGQRLSYDDLNRPPDDENPYTFIPPDPRGYYRLILKHVIAHDLQENTLEPSEPTVETFAFRFQSKQSTELLQEICSRWRLPNVSRIILFLDVIREKFLDQEIDLDTLDAAFTSIKNPPSESRKAPHHSIAVLSDRSKWTLADFSLNQQILSSLHDAILRDLYDTALQCYEAKPPSVGPCLYVLEHHIYDDPSFSEKSEELQKFSVQLGQGLREKAYNIYKGYLEEKLPQDQNSWEFFHLMELGKSVLSIGQRIQKRYLKNPEILGVNPLNALLETILPLFAEDARDIIGRIMQLSRDNGEEVPIEDGFELYKELVEIRSIHAQALQDVPFAFHIEELLADFVWRWVKITDSTILTWVDGAVKQDDFKVRKKGAEDIPTDDERHSLSIIDIFTSFNQTIDRITQLNWDDDLQYAKFMTALSRTVGAGLARYCEIVEQKFLREMDRLTPEQEAAANQSRQEKWMQLAKDAWANKEKIEPFQFFPEVGLLVCYNEVII